MFKYIIALILIVCSAASFAADNNMPMDDFGRLPILHEGRIKPLDSFARLEILKFSKKETPTDITLLVWLANSLFNPADAVSEKIFAVDDPIARHSLGLEERKKPLYSYVELVAGLEKTTPQVGQLMGKPDKSLSPSDKALLSIHENALEYTHILRSFSSVLPLNIELSPEWRRKADLKKDDSVTFSALQKINPEIEDQVKAIIKRKGEDPSKYSAKEQTLVTLGWQLKTIADAGLNNKLFRVIPTGGTDEYASPWELIDDGKGSPSTEKEMVNWMTLSAAWQSQSLNKWQQTLNVMPHDTARLQIEVWYNQIAPFQISIVLFAIALCFSLANFAGRHIYLYQAGFAFLLLAIFIQCAGLATRIYLMERPPVGTLYESILFVGVIAPLVSLFVERRLKNGSGVLSGAISGVMLALLGMSLAGEGDNMKVLGAVLNTRFWLATHVLCITIGYGWCLLTAVLAHLILVGKAFSKTTTETHNDLIKTITTHSLFSLLFTTVGTILGGIWADQSWGRFWGWDPKENGALLIVLWLIWLIHGKIAGQISQIFWICGMAFLSVVVAVAWVGVNLLGVGLHSYGFIEGVFWGLGGFAVFEALLICSLAIKIIQTGRLSHAH
jgi:ABC-type transport system involved in cytochrome c biogenesis permease subunit